MILVQNFAELEVIQTNFNECSSTISGQSGSLVTIDDTDITGCSYKSGFVLSLTSIQNTIQLLGVKYENNNAIIGIIIAYSSANVEIDNVNCSHSSSSYAGGITIENVTGNVLVTNSKFTDCHSDSIAGGICIKNVSTLTVTFTHFINCLSQDTGGEIYISEAGHAEVMKCLFTHCEASETYGGGIYAEKSQKVIATSCNFVNCISFYEGGAILVSNDIITHSISQCIFEGCQSKTGGALAIKCKESFSLFNTRFSKNSGPALHLFMDDIKAHVDIDYCCFSENTGYVHDIVSNFDTPIVFGDQNSFDTERKKAIRIDSRLNSPIDDKSFENTECQADIDPDIPQFDDGSSEYANESPYERKHKIINFGFMDFALFK